MSAREDQRFANQKTFKIAPATAATLAKVITFATDLSADATKFHLTGYGIYFANAAQNAGAMLITQANTSTDPQPGSTWFGGGGGLGSPRTIFFGQDGITLLAADGAITFTYTHGSSVALGGWITGWWE